MPIRFNGGTALFDGPCAVEEAETLLDRLRGGADRRVDLTGCQHVHTAVLQVLMAARPAVAAWPADGQARRWLMAALDDAGGP